MPSATHDVEALNEALARDDPRPARFPHRRGHRGIGGLFRSPPGSTRRSGRAGDRCAHLGGGRPAPLWAPLGRLAPGCRPTDRRLRVADGGPAVNHAAKWRYMSGGKVTVPMVLRGPVQRYRHGGPALPVARVVVRAHSRTRCDHAFDTGRRERAAQERHPRRQPGCFPREAPAYSREGDVPEGDMPCRSAGPTSNGG